jgi:hypothetical protein
MTGPTNTDGPKSPESAAAMPRWVKVFLIIAAALVVLMVVLMLVSGGQHGPGRHRSSSAWTGSVPDVSLPYAPVSRGH